MSPFGALARKSGNARPAPGRAFLAVSRPSGLPLRPASGFGRAGDVEWVDPKQLWAADHMDLRDSRIEIFGHLERGETRRVIYAVRAVSAGRFTLPSAEAEAMYEPRIWARELGRVIDIEGPWFGITD